MQCSDRISCPPCRAFLARASVYSTLLWQVGRRAVTIYSSEPPNHIMHIHASAASERTRFRLGFFPLSCSIHLAVIPWELVVSNNFLSGLLWFSWEFLALKARFVICDTDLFFLNGWYWSFKMLLPPSQIISHSNFLRESKYLKFDQIYI